MNPKSYIIAGPTASGKSDFAHTLARRIGGVVINCDSVQIYRGIENISASPFAGKCGMWNLKSGIDEESAHNSTFSIPHSKLENVPYRLFSVLPLTRQISVAEYLDMARKEYDAAICSGMPAVFVGGTGFYVDALLHGISPIPEISAENRVRAREMARDYPDAACQLLQGADPTAGYDRLDPQRMARALEVFLETARPLSEWQSLPRCGALDPAPKKILICPHRNVLAARIAARVSEMMYGGLPPEALAKRGAMTEARSVIEANWNPERAIGALELVKFIKGEISEKDCLENWITRTNQYAKRQRTWFRNRFAADIEIDHISTDADLDAVLGKL